MANVCRSDLSRMVSVVQTEMVAANLVTPSKIISQMEAERRDKNVSVSKFVLDTVKAHAKKCPKKGSSANEDAEAQNDDGV